MKRYLPFTFAVGILSLMANHGLANEEKAKTKTKRNLHDKFVGQEYGSAGCGLGSVIIGAKPGLAQLAAATSNSVSSNQTFGISSGTLNCVEDSAESSASAREKIGLYVLANRSRLENDIAQGYGESVAALAQMGHCQPSHGLGSSLQENYEQIFAARANHRHISAKIHEILQEQSHCAG